MTSTRLFNCEGQMLIGRRAFLKATAILSFAALPELTLAQQPGDTRLLTILLRGGLDGLYAVPPVGDKSLAKLRRHINPDNTLKLDGFFALHPALKNVHALYQQGQALIVHGASIPYTGRSHFEGQNVMETGVMTPYASQSGWMGRALDLQGYHSLAGSLPVPLILRGKIQADNYYPSWLNAPPKLLESVLPLWGADKALAGYAEQIAQGGSKSSMVNIGDRIALTVLAKEAGNRLKLGSGPRMAVLDHVGFDTHAQEPRDNDRLLAEVDDAIGAFRDAVGEDIWKNTLVVTVTEFGRTAAENGSLGTDHGWGTAAFVLGGALRKSGIVADWPGLKKKELFEERDLRATIDARDLYGTLMSRVLNLDPEQVRRSVFEFGATDLFSAYI